MPKKPVCEVYMVADLDVETVPTCKYKLPHCECMGYIIIEHAAMHLSVLPREYYSKAKAYHIAVCHNAIYI